MICNRYAGPAHPYFYLDTAGESADGYDACINPHLLNGLIPGYDLITITVPGYNRRLSKQKYQGEMKHRAYTD